MSAGDHVSPQQFYHSTNADLKPGDVITPGHPRTHSGPSSADFPELGHHNFTWMTTVKPHPQAKGYGRNHYEVEPMGLHHPYSFGVARGEGRTGKESTNWVSLAGAKVVRKVNDDEPRIGDTKE